MYKRIRPLLFKLDPEKAHEVTLQLLKWAGNIGVIQGLLRAYFEPPEIPVEVFGLKFKNPVGLAAGYDKDAIAWPGLACLGFSHIEIGTVTPKPQRGNPKPRIFRIPEEKALINRMGFPGRGADFVLENLKKKRNDELILGVNIGMNKTTPLEKSVGDYRYLIEKFSQYADYFTVNISSPNTAGLRDLQKRESLGELLRELQRVKREQENILEKRLPLLVKLSPDLSERDLEAAVDVLLMEKVDGVIVTNTTIRRDGLSAKWENEKGGLSGMPLRRRSTEVIRHVYEETGGKLIIIGVGGIMGVDDAKQKLEAGAKLVQVYTGLVYEGPSLVKQIVTGLRG